MCEAISGMLALDLWDLVTVVLRIIPELGETCLAKSKLKNKQRNTPTLWKFLDLQC